MFFLKRKFKKSNIEKIKYKQNIRKWFTIIELLIVVIILSIISVFLFKTIIWLNKYNITLVETIKKWEKQFELQDFLSQNSIADIIYVVMPWLNVELYNNDYKDQDFKDLIEYIKNRLNLKTEINVTLDWNNKTIQLPLLIFKDENNKLGILWWQKDVYNEELNSLNFKLFYINNNYYLKTQGKLTISDLLFLQKNNETSKINDYINDLQSNSLDILMKTVISSDWQWKYSDVNYISPENIQNSIILIPSWNLTWTNISVFQQSIDDLWYAKLYYWYINLPYYKAWKRYDIWTNFLVK